MGRIARRQDDQGIKGETDEEAEIELVGAPPQKLIEHLTGQSRGPLLHRKQQQRKGDRG